MNKKGFTLVELLAVIVVLAIILAIAVPTISKIIETSQTNAFKTNEKMVVKATKTYIGTNESLLPTNIGETREVTLDTLKSSGYINSIIAPDDKVTECDGYVIVTKINNGNYEYTPYLNCENSIGSSTEDGLLLHYKFDDFQESTQNLVSLPFNFSSGYSGNIFAVNSGLLNFNGEDTAWTLNGNGWFARVANAGTIGTQYTTTWYIKAGTTNQVSMTWGGAHGGARTDFIVNLNTGEVSNATVANGEYYEVKPATNGFWQISYSSTLTSSQNYYPQINVGAGSVVLGALQIEQKSYATLFVNGTRIDEVKDYSGKGNSATLGVASTPKWTTNAKVGSGAYTFNGLTKSIDVLHNGLINNNNGSVSMCAWIKPDDPTGDWQAILQNSVGQTATRQWGFVVSSGMRLQYFATINNVWGSRLTSNYTLTKDQWDYVCVTHTHNSSISIYVNGQLDKSGSVTGGLSYTPTYLTIGKRYSAEWFNGDIDDVRIYNRALNDKEIKQLYDIQK